MSPARTSREALAGCPLDPILPSSHACAASARVLKNRAAQSHLSILTRVIIPFSYQGGARLGSGGGPDFQRTRPGPRVASRQGRFSSPQGRKKIAHGASRGNEACLEEPREGAEDGAAAVFRPVPGLRDLAASPRLTPWAIFFRSYEL